MAESSDYSPAPYWSGYSGATARKAYTDNNIAKGTAAAIGVKPTSLIPDKLICKAENPVVIACDVTGSMGEWIATIFSKLPYLEHEGKVYLGDDMEISFAAIGDVFNDRYPLQVQPFSSGISMKESLEKLVHEKGGGGTSEESYDLAAMYYANNAEFPNSIRKPIMIIIGDEGVYSFIAKDHAETWAKVSLQDRMEVKELFALLRKKYNVWIVRKPYMSTTNYPSSAETRIQSQWCELLGDDHVVSLPEADRVVDVIFGILAQETGKNDYFEKELKERQGKDVDGAHKINVVLNSLHNATAKKSMPKLPPPARAKSITKPKPGDKNNKSISLLDD